MHFRTRTRSRLARLPPTLALLAPLVLLAAAEAPRSEPPLANLHREGGELFPYLGWGQVHPLTALDRPLSPVLQPSPGAPAPYRISTVLLKLRETARATMGFTPRPLASPEDEAAFEAAHGPELRAARSSPAPADDLVLAAKLLQSAEAEDDQSGLRRLLLARALALAAPSPQAEVTPGTGEDLAESITVRLLSSLHPEVPADLTARVLAAEALLERAVRQKAGEESLSARRVQLFEARSELVRFQLRNGYLDEARDLAARLARESAGDRGRAEARRLVERVEAQLALRERFQKLLREVEAREEDGARWTALAIFLLSALHDEVLGSEAAARSDHPLLIAFAGAGRLGAPRAQRAQAEKLVELMAHAPPADRRGLAELALEMIEELLSDSPGEKAGGPTPKEAAELKALRERAELAIGSPQKRGAAQSMEIEVPATTAWVPSGVVVKKGQRYRITAQGSWSARKRDLPETDAAGDATLPLEGFPRGALVLQIGAETQTILVGRGLVLAAPESGELFFSMNDSFREFGDNSGKLVVTIEVGPGGMGPRPQLPPAFVGNWATTEKRGASRELRRDGTAWTGVLRGSWAPKNAQEAVLRWHNGAIERMTLQGGRALLKGHSGRNTFQLKKE